MTQTNGQRRTGIAGILLSPVFLLDIALLALGITFLLESQNVRRGFQQVLDARVYPRVVAIIVVLAVGGHLVQIAYRQIKAHRRGDVDPVVSKKTTIPLSVHRKVAIIFALFISYILVIRRVGYFETGFLFLFGSMLALGGLSVRWVIRSLLIAFLIIVAVYLVFGVLLNIYVPRGLILG